MRRALLAFALATVTVPTTDAAAQLQDFATCPATLPACTTEANDCCYKDFPAVGTDRAIIIPMDRCHQQIATSGKESPPDDEAPEWCADPIGTADEGMLQAYGLVYRLMQRGIPVYWLVNPTKDPPALTNSQNLSSQVYNERDIDVWVLNDTTLTPPTTASTYLTACGAGCTDPVRRLDPATLTPIADSYNYAQLPLRGGAFVIAPEDRARFNDLFLRTGEFASLAGDAMYDFSAVDLYELTDGAKIVYQRFDTAGPSYQLGGNGIQGAPVTIRIDYDAPRVARLAPAGVSEVWLSSAKLKDPAQTPECIYGEFIPDDAVYCDVTEEDIQGGSLVFGRFDWTWIDNWSDNSPCGNLGETQQVDEVLEFMTGIPGVRRGGNVMFMDAVIDVFEDSACGSRQPQGLLGTGLSPSNVTPTEPFIIRYPANAFVQWGDLPTTVASGSVTKWNYFGSGASGYDPSHTAAGSLVRLLTVDRSSGSNTYCTNHVSAGSCDVFANSSSADIVDFASYVRFGADPRNGVALYQGGNNVNGRTSHLRLILNGLIAVPNDDPEVPDASTTVREIARSSPIIATVPELGGTERQYQGTIEVHTPAPPMTEYDGASDDATFVFPYLRGHLRAIPTADITTSEQDFSSLPASTDIASIPAAQPAGCGTNFAGTCRTVFTTVASPDTTGLASRPDHVLLDTDNVALLKPYLGSDLADSEAQTLISRILAGAPDGAGGYQPALGAIDRSTVAVIEPSPLIPPAAGAEDRPTMIYVGATDGMLHAFCAEAKGACPAEGVELWAFMPRTQLALARTNTTRIDGSPKVADVLDDFDGDDIPEWRTILTLQTGWGVPGFANRAPAIIAIDVTDPAAPEVLWERTTPSTRDVVDQGVGVNLAMGAVRVNGTLTNLTFAQTNNGGTGDPANDDITPGGFWLGAIDTESGALVWEVGQSDPTPRSNSNPAAPTSGIPGGAAIIDINGAGLYATHVVVSSLYGDLWVFEADDGVSPYIDASTGAAKPVFRFSTDLHPVGQSPTIYADMSTGRMYAAFASGGYVDQLSPLGLSWSPQTTDQYVVSVAVDPSAANVPMNELASSDYGTDRAFSINLGAGNRGFAQAVVAGNELYVTTDSSNVNGSSYGTSSTGSLRRINLTTNAQVGSTLAIRGGGSSAETSSDGQTVYVGGGGSTRKAGVEATFGTAAEAGKSIELDAEQKTTRLMWLSS